MVIHQNTENSHAKVRLFTHIVAKDFPHIEKTQHHGGFKAFLNPKNQSG